MSRELAEVIEENDIVHIIFIAKSKFDEWKKINSCFCKQSVEKKKKRIEKKYNKWKNS